jgi:hypothetical protein
VLERPPDEVERPRPVLATMSLAPPAKTEPPPDVVAEPTASPAVEPPALAVAEPPAPAVVEPPATAAPPWIEPGSAPKATALTPEVMEQGRSCPQCGTRNADGAVFCWQCYRPFPQQPGMRAPGSMISAGASALSSPITSTYAVPIGSPIRSTDSDPDPAKESNAKKWITVALVAVIAVVAVGAGKTAWDSKNRTHLQVPAAISGMQRIDDPRLAQSITDMERIASDNGSTGKAGFYGYSGIPSFFFAAFEYKPSSAQSPDDIFRQFSGGFATGGTQTVDLESETTSTVGEATFICAKLKGKPSGSICMWADKDIVGFVGAFGQDTKVAQSLTAAVRASVET